MNVINPSFMDIGVVSGSESYASSSLFLRTFADSFFSLVIVPKLLIIKSGGVICNNFFGLKKPGGG